MLDKKMNMIKFFLPLFIVFFTFNVQANIIKDLKRTEASQFDVGMLRLDIVALAVKNKLQGERIRGTDFEFGNVSTFSNNEQLGLNVSFTSDSENLSQSSCETMKLYTAKMFDKKTLSALFGKGFDAEESADLMNRIKLNTILVDEDNLNMTFKCN
ncbi:hypothetical protein GNP80_07085 [Aliivibrio fischeri]|uniref:hypothetical protein n=1 Tax=Aliivibrio fischeri TaxID=668 RepID=UPI0012D9ED63|nr:hypothetical protein [Aliivibrio fischeri]MUK92199.1 hypothetical protein [Aliivibrio fischeri]